MAAGNKKKSVIDRKVSIIDLVEPEELKFARTYLGFDKKWPTESYRRTMMRKNGRGEFVDFPKSSAIDQAILDDETRFPALDPKQISKRATALLGQAHIIQLIDELENSTSDHARQVLRDQVLFGDDKQKLTAAQRIMAEEDRLGFRDAVEMWADILCEIGAEVVIPLGKTTRTAHCSHCGEENEFKIDLAVELPFEELMKKE